MMRQVTDGSSMLSQLRPRLSYVSMSKYTELGSALLSIDEIEQHGTRSEETVLRHRSTTKRAAGDMLERR